MIQRIVDDIHDKEDFKNKGRTEIYPVQYENAPGITSCFVFRGETAEDPSPAFMHLNDLASNLNSQIAARIVPDNWRFLAHAPHVTASSIIDPIQGQEIPPEPYQSFLWQAILKSFSVLTEVLPQFHFTFHRLHVGLNGTVVVFGYPSTEKVGEFKEMAFRIFKSERWWDDLSAAAVIGRFEPIESSTQGSSFRFPFQKVQDAFKLVAVNQQINVKDLWLIQYTNRLINPDRHVKRLARFYLHKNG